jgi:TPR repeat protein
MQNTSSPEWKESASLAAKYYMLSAEQEDLVGLHWMGIFLHEGFGCSKDVSKAIEFLTKAANAGNGRSMYQLFLIHSGNEGYDPSLKKPENAYIYLLRSLSYGVNSFDEAAKYFNDHYAILAPVYVFSKSLPI